MHRSRRCTTISATVCTVRRSLGVESRTSLIPWAVDVRFRRALRDLLPFRRRSSPTTAQSTRCEARPEKFAEHYAQAKFFFESQTGVEKAHIRGAFRFELSKLTVPAIRVRVISSLLNVSKELARSSLKILELSCPTRCRARSKALRRRKFVHSPALVPQGAARATAASPPEKSRFCVADGVDPGSITDLIEALNAAGAVTRLLGTRLGTVASEDGEPLEIDATLENSPAVLFDAVVLPAGSEAVDALCLDGHTLEFVKDQYRHCKTILALGDSSTILAKAGIPLTLPSGEQTPAC